VPLSPTYASLAAQLTALRYRVGQGTSTEIVDDSELTECLNAALRELNRMASLWVLGSFDTVAGQQRYTETEANVPSNAYRPIHKIFWGYNGAVADPISAGLLNSCGCLPVACMLMDGYPIDAFDPAAREIIARDWSLFQRYLGGRGKQLKDDYIWLDPEPGSVQTVYYFVRTPRFAASDDVDDQWAEALMDLAEAKACMLIAGKQSEVERVSAGFGKSVTTAGGRIYHRMAKDAEYRFYQAVQAIPKIYRVG
jgi:hypothetical protein